MKFTRYLVPTMLAGSLLVGSASGVFAAKSKVAAHRASAYGQVSNLMGSGFTLTWTPKKAGSTASPKSVHVLVSSTTKEKARAGTTGPLTNGEYALVVGTRGAAGIVANRVLYSKAAFNAHRLLRRHLAAGVVNRNATTATSLAITTAKGKTLVFAITPQTKYRVNKVLTTTAPTFTNGEKVRVRFALNPATKARTALLITVVPIA
jgi:hypothetical protein